jgi:hypothetical protein
MTVTKEADMGKKADEGTRPATAEGAGEGADLPERWSAARREARGYIPSKSSEGAQAR